MTHICVSKLTINGSDNGFSPDRRQAIIWTNAGILLIGPLRTNFSEILIEILTFSFKKMRLKVSSAKRRPFCLGLNVLKIADKALTLKLGISAYGACPAAGTRLKFKLYILSFTFPGYQRFVIFFSPIRSLYWKWPTKSRGTLHHLECYDLFNLGPGRCSSNFKV